MWHRWVVVVAMIWTHAVGGNAAVPPDDDENALIQRFLELHQIAANDPAKAVKGLQELLGKVEKLFPNSQLESHVATTAAKVAQDLGKSDDAEKHFRRSLAIIENRKLEQDLPVALFNLARLYLNQSKYDQARPLLEQCRRVAPPGNPVRAYAIDGLAQIHLDFGEFGPATALFKEALKLRQDAKDAGEIAVSYSYLGLLAQSLGQFGEARAWYEKSLKLVKDDPAVLHNLGDLSQAEDNFDDAILYYEKSLKIRAARPNRPELAKTQHSLANAYAVKGRFEEAADLLDQCLTIRKLAAPESVEVALTLNSIGRLHYLQGDYDRAKKQYGESLRLYQRHFPEIHPQLAITRNNLALVLAAEGNVPAAAEAFNHVRREVRRYTFREVPIKPGPEQRRFLGAMKNWSLDHALTLGYANPKDEAAVVNSAAWLVNGKAVVHEALAEAIALTNEQGSKDKRIADASRELREVRQAISRWSMLSDSAGIEPGKYRALALREQTLVDALREAGIDLVGGSAWVGINAIAKLLPPDAALIEVKRLRPYHFQARGVADADLPERYVAWVIRPDGRVRLFDLGLAETIDRAVENVRELMAQDEGRLARVQRFPEEEERRIRSKLQKLSDLMAPLLATLKDTPRWIVSPDDALWLTPWEALFSNGDYAVKRHVISYVVSGRELLPRARAERMPGPPLILGDPDFDWSAAGEPRKPEKDRAAPLPNAAADLESISAAVTDYVRQAPRIHKRQFATAEALRKAAAPRVLVLNTHGFYESTAASSPDDRRAELPLLRCGILLAGCNRVSQSKTVGDGGILLGLDILGIDLRGTELVVLGACETALGDVHAGEGVAGLRQAFQLAGADNVVASLWKVTDDSAALLMKEFFANLSRKQPRAVALRNAQLRIMQEHRHPTFWAAFTITGRAD